MFNNHREYVQICQLKPTPSERVSHLQRLVSQSNESHSKIVSGLLFTILTATTDQQQVCELFRELATIVRDFFKQVIFMLSQLVLLNFKLLRQQTVERIIYITGQLIAKNAPNTKDLVQSLLQQVSVSKIDHQSVSLLLR